MDLNKDKVIFVRLPNWVGDVCMSLPALNALIDTEVPVVVCARPWAKDLLSAYQIADFISMDHNWLKNANKIRNWRKQHSVQNALGLLLPDSLSSALAFKYAGINSCGYKDDGRSFLLRWPVDKPLSKPHAVISWYKLSYTALKLWQLKLPNTEPADKLGWHVAAEHEKKAIQTYTSAGLNKHQFILIAPTAVGLHKGHIKVWQHFEELTCELKQHGYTVVMAPPKTEREIANDTVPSANLLPELGLGAFTALTKHASLVICNDSGVSHLSAAAGANQITLFGVTDSQHTGPWSAQAIKLGQMGAWPNLSEVSKTALDFLNNKQNMHEC